MPQQNSPKPVDAFQAYLSDFYYAMAIIFLLASAYFLFNEPIGVSMLSFDLSLMLVVFAIIYIAATFTGEMILKFLSKYLVLIGLMIAAYQFRIDFGYTTTLQVLFWISIVIFFIIFIFDFLSYFKDMVTKIWEMIAKRR